MSGDDKQQQQQRHISLRVVSGDGSEVFFKISSTTPLSKLISAYCKRKSIEESSVRFLYDGERIDPSKSATDLDMEDDDIIDALVQQTGGGDGCKQLV